ncbi:MAG: acriflavine resistance protein B [Deltaproteobacteria bacterium HGW-Deltaproteobacteria-21]|nr:MAG: acriflavine resistance protein B [Deltaproteobacteria bacterium HGW-Deltaproteobacteria-21]
MTTPAENPKSWLDGLIWFSLKNKVIVFMVILLIAAWGILVAPFDWGLGGALRNPVAMDAIPDIGENQQIVFTQWQGRSPQDIEDQITYPLTTALLGIPGVKSIRSYSQFGFSSIYVIFKDRIDFYWTRSRILEKLNSLSDVTLPEGVQPTLGPDATAMGQVFWYTLEGRDPEGRPTGGWDLHELRTIQDYYVRYALLGVEGVSEVASVGGFVQEYQVDLDPDRMLANDVSLDQVVAAIRGANRDVGAQTIEVNRVEYLVRGIGFIKGLEDLGNAVIKLNANVPVFVRQVANVSLGPATREGALDKGGAEAAGGVVVVRFGANPLEVIQEVWKKIRETAPGMPEKTLADGTKSQVRIVPFYDRTELIHESLDTLRSALFQEIVVTIVVIVALLGNLGSSLLISGLLPLSVLMCFIVMKIFGVEANIVALSGIAIAIGTMVDMGIIITENILRHLDRGDTGVSRLQTVFMACQEVGGAVLAAVSTTIVGFLPVFTMEAAEGKLFRPLAFTKTIALCASLFTAVFIIPPLAHLLFSSRLRPCRRSWVFYEGLIYLGAVLAFVWNWKLGLVVGLIGAYNLLLPRIPEGSRRWTGTLINGLVALSLSVALAGDWAPLGLEKGFFRNAVFVVLILGVLLGLFVLYQRHYRGILNWCLDHKKTFLSIPLGIMLVGAMIWQSADTLTGRLPRLLSNSPPVTYLAKKFPGLGEEFMPPLDEGSFLYMPSTMPHASIGEAMDIVRKQDRALAALPEVEGVVGKLGRVQSALDPAPISMIETLITYRHEFLQDEQGSLPRFRFSPREWDLCRDLDGKPLTAPDRKPYLVWGRFVRDEQNRLIPDPHGRPFRVWRPALDPALNPGRDPWKGIQDPNDIWESIVHAADIPGATSAPKLQPISARMVMLQSGIRASLGIRVTGPDLETIQKVSLRIEAMLREVPSVSPGTVIADRVLGKPYLEINVNRETIAQYGINLEKVLEVIEYAIGGNRVTTTVEKRERYPVRVRYIRELRDELESIGRVLVPTPNGVQVPLMQLAEITYVRGPMQIRGENGFLTGYVLFDKIPGVSEVQAVEQAREYLKEKIEYGEFEVPPGVTYSFTGNYEGHVRSKHRLMLILPLSLFIIFVILYLQFRSAITTAIVFSGIPVAWAGGFIMLWLYGQPWFLNFSVFDTSMRELFQVHPVNLSVAVWVGFLALFGIAEDDGVVMATYLDQSFAGRRPGNTAEIRAATVEACLRRIRPCVMTTATTILALLPVFSSTGRGAEIMVPMAIPSLGGMMVEMLASLVVPVLYCGVKEWKLGSQRSEDGGQRSGI